MNTRLAAVLLSLVVAGCGGGGSGPDSQPPANAAPLANAGTLQNVLAGAVVALNGSASSDANGDALTFAWTLTARPAGSTAVLSGETSATPTFTADVAGTYVASLVVNDGNVSSTAATVTVTAAVANAAPVANAGAAQSVTTGTAVTLNGSASTDANGDALTFAWTLTARPAGSAAVLSGETSATPTFTADVAGTYVASLVVNDGKVSSTAATVTVTAAVANAAPVANAGAAQSVTTGTAVTLNGSASTDANGDALTFAWTLTARPAGSTAVLSGETSATPTFTADVAGTYVASLVVNDGKVSSTAATVTVTAAVANAAPVANAGAAQSVTTGTAVTLNGGASSDANGDALTFAWTLTARPAGSAAVLSGETSATPTFTADVAGTYVATLVVNDGKVSSTAATVTVTAVSPLLVLIAAPSNSCSVNCVDQVLSLPYSGSATHNLSCVGSGCPPAFTLQTFRLRATGASFSVINVAAENMTAGSTVAPSFVGLANSQAIGNGETVTFSLAAERTWGSTVNLRFSFTVRETGHTFVQTLQVTSN